MQTGGATIAGNCLSAFRRLLLIAIAWPSCHDPDTPCKGESRFRARINLSIQNKVFIDSAGARAAVHAPRRVVAGGGMRVAVAVH